MHWCVSVNSDTGVFLHVLVSEGCYCIPVLSSGSCEGYPKKPGQGKRERIRLALTGGRGHSGPGEAVHSYLQTPQIHTRTQMPTYNRYQLILPYNQALNYYSYIMLWNIKQAHLMILTQESDHIYYGVLMLSTHSVN